MMYTSYGLPLDISLEILRERNIFLTEKDILFFEELFKQHQKVSRGL